MYGQPSLTQYSPLSIVEGPMVSPQETRFKNSPTRTLNKDSPLGEILNTHHGLDHQQSNLTSNLMELTIANVKNHNVPKAEPAPDSAIDTEEAGERSAPISRKEQPMDSAASLPAQWHGVDSNLSPPFDGHPSLGRGSLSKIHTHLQSPRRTGIAGFGSVLERQSEASRAMNNAGHAPAIA